MLPFENQPKLIFHGAHHKMGTVWITRVLESIGNKYGLSVQKVKRNTEQLLPGTDIVIASHSDMKLERIGDFVGSHMTRDPRDAIVSGYFYHLWTNEAWAHQPQEELDGQSFQQPLPSLGQEEGILSEIRRFQLYTQNRNLLDWNFDDERILEIKYEDLIENEEAGFRRMFRHYGFVDSAVETCLELARQFSFSKIAQRGVGQTSNNRHLRSGKPGQWRELFSDVHVEAVKSQFGELLIRWGYEENQDW